MIIPYTGSLFCYANPAKYGLRQSYWCSSTRAFTVPEGRAGVYKGKCQGSEVHYSVWITCLQFSA